MAIKVPIIVGGGIVPEHIFLVAPSLPNGVDVILGMDFARKTKAQLSWEGKGGVVLHTGVLPRRDVQATTAADLVGAVATVVKQVVVLGVVVSQLQ